MVTQFGTEVFSTDPQGRRLRRRNLIPVGIVCAVLLVVAIGVWAMTAARGSDKTTNTACPTAPNLTVADRSALIDTNPAPITSFGVRVLNSTSKRGAAQAALDTITEQGFTAAATDPVGDDTAYSPDSLSCVGQIRYGQGGAAAAAALWILLPCTEPVQINRSGRDVDLVIGNQWEAPSPSQDAQAVLQSLQTMRTGDPQSAPDPALIRAVHNQQC